MKTIRPALALLGLLALSAFARADVSLPKILGDGMVLQRELSVPIWGHAGAGDAVTVRFAGQEKQTKADATGAWRVALDPLKASAEPRELTVTGANTITLKNVLVGEVWFCSGQSNMEYAVSIASSGAPAAAPTDPALAEEIKTAHYATIRLFRVEKQLRPPEVVSNGWQECTGEALGKFSAIGFFFGQDLQRALNIPVGVIQSSWGGARIAPWTPKEAVSAEEFAKLIPSDQRGSGSLGTYYNGMVRPLVPFALRGVLWYQGESQIIAYNDGLRFADKLETLITAWRSAWGRPDLPFYSVQIAPFLYSSRKDALPHASDELPKLWEAQALSLAIPHTGLVATTDLVDDLKNIHPGHKREVGARLAALALTEIYGQSQPFAGPTYSKLEVTGAKAVVHYTHAAGLVARDGKPLTDFEVAGADGQFVPADAVIRNDAVEISSPQVTAPVSVRFGWTESARPNLINHDGLPAYPFRTTGPTWTPASQR